MKVSLFYQAYTNERALISAVNSYIELVNLGGASSVSVSCFIAVDGGGLISSQCINSLHLDGSAVTIRRYSENLGNCDFTFSKLEGFVSRIRECMQKEAPDIILFFEDDNRCFARPWLAKKYLNALMTLELYAIVSNDSKNKFCDNEMLLLEGYFKSKLHQRSWAAFGGTHLHSIVADEMLETILAIGKLYENKNMALFFDKLLHAALNKYEKKLVIRGFIGDASMGLLTRLGLRFPVVHGLKYF